MTKHSTAFGSMCLELNVSAGVNAAAALHQYHGSSVPSFQVPYVGISILYLFF